MNNSEHQVQGEQIRAMFAKVAGKYDQANQVLSFGIHHLWRKKLVALSGAKSNDKVLDCATGTGDLAFEFKRAVGSSGEVIGTDFCAEMLEPAPKKSVEKKLHVDFKQADVMDLPFADNTFDIVSISFGIRNVEDPVKGLKEMSRVLKPGGRLMVLEFSQVTWPIFSDIYNFYSKKILPKMGGIISGQMEAYEYLQKSSAAFPAREKFLELMQETQSLSELRYWSLTGGIAAIYRGIKSHH